MFIKSSLILPIKWWRFVFLFDIVAIRSVIDSFRCVSERVLKWTPLSTPIEIISLAFLSCYVLMKEEVPGKRTS